MPITLTYGPIASAMQLAQQSGEGVARARRQQDIEAALSRVDRQADQLIQRRGMEMSSALARERLRQSEQQAAEQLAMRQAQMQADQQYRQQRLGQYQSAEQRQQKGLELQERGMDLREREMGLRYSPEAQPWTKTPAAMGMKERIRLLEDELKTAERTLKQSVDPIAEKIGRLEPRQGMEDTFTEAYTSLNQLRQELAEARQAYQQGLERGQIPQYGAEAASETAGRATTGGGGTEAATKEIVQQQAAMVAQMIAQQLPRTLRGDRRAVERAVADVLISNGRDPTAPESRQFVSLVTEMVMGGS